MHEALEIKIHELIEEGEEHKVQWGKLLETFAGINISQIVHALTTLNPNQLSSIKDGIEKAENESKQQSLKSMKHKMIELGITPEDFAIHLGLIIPEGYSSKKKQEKKSGYKRSNPEAKAYAEEILRGPTKYSVIEINDKLKIKFGEELAHSTIYALKKKVKDSMQ